jgi:uncharacterized protein
MRPPIAACGRLAAEQLERLRAAAEQACAHAEPSHDMQHVLRVCGNARRLAAAEGAAEDVVLAAALLHELFNYPKGHPESHRSGQVCAEHARKVLLEVGAARELLEPVCTCIREHAFSAGVSPGTAEGRVVQDADRLDALGAIGVARCFATCASMGRPFYDPQDPFCRARPPDDKQWGLDHFYRKLLRLGDGLHTPAARAMAGERVAFLRLFLEQLEREL